MKKTCASFTCKGDLCKIQCVENTPYCNRHNLECQKLREEYVKVCADYWNYDCHHTNSLFINEMITYFSERCKKLRLDYAIKCCGGKADAGHYGAILKMIEKLEKCKDAKQQHKIMLLNKHIQDAKKNNIQ